MRADCAVSVVVSTFNRAEMLRQALDSLTSQAESTPAFEVIVVDNNSTDHTRRVVEQSGRSSRWPVRYVSELRQGLSHARNAGIAVATATIVAFTDDDVAVSPGWVEAIDTTFAARPDVQCLGGRTLPLWPSPPPGWLTAQHWVGPLALQDYGSQPLIIDASRPLCLAGANLAFRRSVFDEIGLFSVEFPRAQDTELLLRMYRAGFRSLYVPEMVVQARVAPDRLTKAYHRRWHTNIGRCNARMRFYELSDPVLGLRQQVPNLTRVFGVPLFAIRQLASALWKWSASTALGRESDAFRHETRARALASYMIETRRMSASTASVPPVATTRSPS